MNIRNLFLPLVFLGVLHSGYSQNKKPAVEKVGESEEVVDKNIDWEYFDSTSIAPINAIKIEHLQGVWKTFKGLYKFREQVNIMKLTTPFILEIKADTYRRNSDAKFAVFSIDANQFVSKKKNADVGIINKITATELIITWKDGANYTRYYYSLQ